MLYITAPQDFAVRVNRPSITLNKVQLKKSSAMHRVNDMCTNPTESDMLALLDAYLEGHSGE
jgi:hypothetical protein